ncbi:uncharacterized protein LOC134648218 [Cydia amplana]|uniref:uncharacterized protein LOC134648218 n=1 Tax=Cydia amplana TaxID=1869771 RepID=UPI002FE53E0F
MGNKDNKEDLLQLKIDNMCAVEYKMPPSLNLDNIENSWPQWQKFKLSFKNFVLAAGFDKLSEARKAAILINCIGPEAQELYFNVLKKEDKDKLDEVIQIFDDYFKPKQNEVINRYNFNKRNQEEGESFDAYYTAIRKLAENCNFDDKKDRMIRDKIAIGVRDQRVQQKLLEVKDLTLDKAVDICRSTELSKEFVKTLNNPEVHAVQSGRPVFRGQQLSKAKYFNNNNSKSWSQSANVKHNNTTNYNSSFYKCRKCNTEHGPRQCPAFGKICSKCNKPNHFSVGCTFSKQRVHYVTQDEGDVACNDVQNL